MEEQMIQWRSDDSLHRSWTYQVGEINGRKHRMLCDEFNQPPTAHNCNIHLVASVDQQLRSLDVDDPALFVQHYVAGFLIGFGVFATEELAEAPF